jgi:hypothetical protein
MIPMMAKNFLPVILGIPQSIGLFEGSNVSVFLIAILLK